MIDTTLSRRGLVALALSALLASFKAWMEQPEYGNWIRKRRPIEP